MKDRNNVTELHGLLIKKRDGKGTGWSVLDGETRELICVTQYKAGAVGLANYLHSRLSETKKEAV